jgi:hypothetical protein
MEPRVAFFGILSESSAAGQDEYQLFRWLFMEKAFGIQSKEFAHALIDDKLQERFFGTAVLN